MRVTNPFKSNLVRVGVVSVFLAVSGSAFAGQKTGTGSTFVTSTGVDVYVVPDSDLGTEGDGVVILSISQAALDYASTSMTSYLSSGETYSRATGLTVMNRPAGLGADEVAAAVVYNSDVSNQFVAMTTAVNRVNAVDPTAAAHTAVAVWIVADASLKVSGAKSVIAQITNTSAKNSAAAQIVASSEFQALDSATQQAVIAAMRESGAQI